MAFCKLRQYVLDARAVSAVEFALVAPLFLFLLLGIACFGYIFGVHHELQQIASEAARAAVAGTTDSQRDSLARDFAAASVSDYLLLDNSKLTVTTITSELPVPLFQVAVAYDLTRTCPYRLGGLVPLPNPHVERRAAIQRGSY